MFMSVFHWTQTKRKNRKPLSFMKPQAKIIANLYFFESCYISTTGMNKMRVIFPELPWEWHNIPTEAESTRNEDISGNSNAALYFPNISLKFIFNSEISQMIKDLFFCKCRKESMYRKQSVFRPVIFILFVPSINFEMYFLVGYIGDLFQVNVHNYKLNCVLPKVKC